VFGKAIKIAGGDYQITQRRFICQDCEHAWDDASSAPNVPQACPKCQGTAIQRLFR
jgi:predicted Zn-ribbon and HTH transcriptional regulator